MTIQRTFFFLIFFMVFVFFDSKGMNDEFLGIYLKLGTIVYAPTATNSIISKIEKKTNKRKKCKVVTPQINLVEEIALQEEIIHVDEDPYNITDDPFQVQEREYDFNTDNPFSPCTNNFDLFLTEEYRNNNLNITKNLSSLKSFFLDGTFDQNNELTVENVVEEKVQVKKVKKKYIYAKEQVTCDVCNKSMCKTSLAHHIRSVHIKEKDCKCLLCDKEFISSARLRMHINGIGHNKNLKILKEDAFALQELKNKVSTIETGCVDCLTVYRTVKGYREHCLRKHKVINNLESDE